jgi:glycogen debranching enzyme
MGNRYRGFAVAVSLVVLCAGSSRAGKDDAASALSITASGPDAAAGSFDGGIGRGAAPNPVVVGPSSPNGVSAASPRQGANQSAGASGRIAMAAAPAAAMTPVIEGARALAADVVAKDTYQVQIPGTPGPRLILTAGSAQYKTLWTRDACFGMLGLVADPASHRVVTDTLQTIFDRASSAGQLPRRQADHDNPFLMMLSFLGIKTPAPTELNRYEYVNELNVPQFDATMLPLILAGEYLKATGDKGFIAKNFATMKMSAAWLEAVADKTGGGLIDQPGSADWKDMVRRSGKTAYANVLLYKASASMAEMSRAMADGPLASGYDAFAQRTKTAVNAELWDGQSGYYRDGNETQAFSPDGNMLAIIWDVADKERTDRIMDRLEALLAKSPLPFPALDGEYPENRVPLIMKLMGNRHYQDTDIWPWEGNVCAVAAMHAGRKDLAVKVLARVAAQAVKDGTFYEVYSQDGKSLQPVRTLGYKSEPDFLWSAGTYLWAHNAIAAAPK